MKPGKSVVGAAQTQEKYLRNTAVTPARNTTEILQEHHRNTAERPQEHNRNTIKTQQKDHRNTAGQQ